ncbi:hypothetical protein LWI29_033724 [Acer saccharum]|uniref:Uncharacterized protein n=1 Tax=Acer saccharum TaxID=4024 RepID=A0AA39TJ12_ACESA|nr:hypothetical protein LWI29_033724 [Acer saccharum]
MGRIVAGQKHVEGGDQRQMDDGRGGEEFGGGGVPWRLGLTGVNNNASTTFNPTSQQRSGRERNWVIQIQEYESGWLLSDLFLVSNQELKLKFTFKLQLLS